MVEVSYQRFSGGASVAVIAASPDLQGRTGKPAQARAESTSGSEIATKQMRQNVSTRDRKQTAENSERELNNRTASSHTMRRSRRRRPGDDDVSNPGSLTKKKRCESRG